MSYPKFCEYCYSPENTGTVIKPYLIKGSVKYLCEKCLSIYTYNNITYKTNTGVKNENNRWW